MSSITKSPITLVVINIAEEMDFDNFMSKKLGGKYKALAAPNSPDQTLTVAPQVNSTTTSQPSSPSTPVALASSSTTASGSGETVTKLLRKQSLTRMQLNNLLQKRVDKIMNLSKKKTENEKEKEISHNTTSKVIEEENNEANESTVVRQGNYIKSNNGFFRTIQDRDDSLDEELSAEDRIDVCNEAFIDAETVEGVENEIINI